MESMTIRSKSYKHILIGGGGHAASVLSIVKLLGIRVEGYIALTESNLSSEILYLGSNEILEYGPENTFKHIISFNFFNKKTQLNYKNFVRNYSQFLESCDPIIHPSAVIDHNVSIGKGTVVGAGAVIRNGTNIGNHCLINSSATIDHDCQVGDYSHVAPGAVLCGYTRLGCYSLVGAGATVLNSARAMPDGIVKAGSVYLP